MRSTRHIAALLLTGFYASALVAERPPPSRTEAARISEAGTMATTNLASAIAHLGHAPDAGQSPALMFALGNLQLLSTNLVEAVTCYRHVVAAVPSDVEAWDHLGRALLMDEQYADAADAFRRCISIAGRTPEPLALLGRALLANGQTTIAAAAFRDALLLDNNTPDAGIGLLQALLQQEQFAEAAMLVASLLEAQPNDPELWRLKANLELARENTNGAITSLETARRLGLASGEMLALLGDLYINAGNTAGGAAAYRESIAGQPTVERLLHAAEGLLGAQEPQEAQRLLDRVNRMQDRLKQNPRLGIRYLRLRAMAIQQTGDPADAREDYERLLEADPLNGDALLALGRIAQAAHKIDKARLLFERASRLSASELDAELALADLEIQLQHYREALQHIDNALRIDDSPALRRYQKQVRALDALQP